MEQKFLEYIEENHLIKNQNLILLGVSGGIDSVVMLHLFQKTGLRFAVAHCNFQLRGNDANADEQLVEQLANDCNVPYHAILFNTKAYANRYGISIQMAARQLRYQWFDDLCAKHNYQAVAIAHNSDDVIETLFINLARGTGIHGITGIKTKQGNIIRPLLFASRQMIEDYCNKHNLVFREDSSNKETKYSRNKIRHRIIPEFEQINPNFRKNILQNINHFADAEMIYKTEIENKRKQCLLIKENRILIKIDKIKDLHPLQTYLFEFLQPYGFDNKITNSIGEALHSESGKRFYSDTHQLIKDRKHLIIEPITENNDKKEKEIQNSTKKIIIGQYQLTFEKMEWKNKSVPLCKPNEAYIDYNKLQFPLTVRYWQAGDFFLPLGMTKRKKLSDFFIDQKINILDKAKTPVLCSGKDIVWVINNRIDNRFKITPETNFILYIKCSKVS